MKKLELPYLATIPYSVQSDDTISDAAKVFFGQITGLSVKYGYLWATNAQFAEMKKTSQTNIERWLRLLEKGGHIRRETKNIARQSTAGKWGFVSTRKIYILNSLANKTHDEESDIETEIQKTEENIEKEFTAFYPTDSDQPEVPKNEAFETSENEDSLDTSENEDSVETSESGGVNINSLDSNKKEVPIGVLFFKSLDLLQLDQLEKIKISSMHSEADVDIAVARALKWEGRSDDKHGIYSTLKNKTTWTDIETDTDIEKKNMKFLKTFEKYDRTIFSLNRINVGNKYIEFISGAKCTVFDVSQKLFIKMVNDYFEMLRAY